MKQSKFTEEQIKFALKHSETGTAVTAASETRSGKASGNNARQIGCLEPHCLPWARLFR